MAQIKSFRDLIAWQKAMVLAQTVYRATNQMPQEERFGLSLQMRRAAVSIPSNIAEGYGRQSRKDYLKFLRIARGSLGELATQHELAISLHMIPANEAEIQLLHEVDRILQGLIRSLS